MPDINNQLRQELPAMAAQDRKIRKAVAAQHADQAPDFQRQCLALLEAAVAAQEAAPQHLLPSSSPWYG